MATNGTNGTHDSDSAFFSFKGQKAVVFAGTEGAHGLRAGGL